MPVVAISTAPGLASDGSQHPTTVVAFVVGISGLAHQVAARNGSLPSSADTICHGGTRRLEGFEMSPAALLKFVIGATRVSELLAEMFVGLNLAAKGADPLRSPPQPGNVSALNLNTNHQSTGCPVLSNGVGAFAGGATTAATHKDMIEAVNRRATMKRSAVLVFVS